MHYEHVEALKEQGKLDREHLVDHQVSSYGPDTLDEIVPVAPTADAEASLPSKIKEG